MVSAVILLAALLVTQPWATSPDESVSPDPAQPISVPVRVLDVTDPASADVSEILTDSAVVAEAIVEGVGVARRVAALEADAKHAVVEIHARGAAELLDLLPHLKRRGTARIALVGRADSSLARGSDVALDASVDREVCPLNLAPTASTAVAMMRPRGFRLRSVPAFSLPIMTALAPSTIPEELPGV